VLGYNPLREFRSTFEIAPMLVLDKPSLGSSLECVGDSIDLFEKPAQMPEIQKGVSIDITSDQSTNITAKATIKFVKTFVKKDKEEKPELDDKFEVGLTAAFTKVCSYVLTLKGSAGDAVNSTYASRFLTSSSRGGLNTDAYVTSRILDNTSERNPAYIITETLMATEIVIDAKDKNDISIKPNLDILLKTFKECTDLTHNVTGTDMEFKVVVNDDAKVEVTTPFPLVYAIKIAPIWIRYGKVTMTPPSILLRGGIVPFNTIPGYGDYDTCFELDSPEILHHAVITPEGMYIDVKRAEKK
jgi:hypothetical protein